MTTIRRATALLALAALLVLTAAVPAAGHARLVASDPAGGAIQRQAPTQVRLTFSERIERDFAQVQVFAPSGARVDVGAPEVAGEMVSVALAPLTEPGTYEVAFRVISEDSHPIQAGYQFEVVAEAVSPSPSPEPTEHPTDTASRTDGDTATPGDDTGPEGPEAPEARSDSGPGALVIAGTVAGVVLLTGLLSFLRRRRRT